MINETQKLHYVLIVEGVEITRADSEAAIAFAKMQLSAEKQLIAEIKHVADDGKQVLWG